MIEEPQRPPIADSPISVLLTAHNVEAEADAALQAWQQLLATLDRDYEIIVVDDDSSDRTADIVAAVASSSPRIKLLRHDKHRGVGAALRTGLAAAQHPLLLYSVCDRRYDPADLRSILKDIDQVDVVSGYRGGRPMPISLRFLGRVYRLFIRVLFGVPLQALPGWLGWRGHLYSWLVRIFFGVRIFDIDSEYKLFRRAVFSRIPIQSDRSFVHAEILAKANFLGCLMTESLISYRSWSARERPGTIGPLLAEAYRVFCRPDFGPVMRA